MWTSLVQAEFHRSAICRYFIIGSIAVLSLGCGAVEEQKRIEKVKEASQAFIKQMNDSPSTEDKSTWGLNQFYVFGPPLLWKDDIGTKQLDDPSLSYEATAAVWYHGTTSAGQSIKEQRTIVRQVKPDGESNWHVASYQLNESTPLSFWKQVGYWLLMSYLGPLCCLGMIGGLFILWDSNPIANALLLLFLVGALIWSGRVSYYSFGSGVAVVLCVPLFAFLNLFLLRLIRGRKSQ